MPIAVVCPSCAAKMQAPESAAGRKAKCPKCGTTLLVPKPGGQFAHQPPPPPSLTSSVPTPAPGSLQLPEDFDFAARPDGSAPQAHGESPRKSVPSAGLTFQQLDIYTKIAAGAGLVGLLVLGVSPLFRWINFASGGVIGMKGDGKIVLGITLVAIVICVAVLIKPRWLKTGVVAVQAWGTVAVFWMAALIWKVGSAFDSPDVQGNPFVGLIVTQISPGAGLYLGLIGALVVAGALGFIAVRRSAGFGAVWPYLATQGFSLAVGLLLAFYVGPSGPSNREAGQANAPDLSWPLPSAKTAADRASAQAKWKRDHNVSDKQWEDMIANYRARKHPESVTEMDWWEEAKDKTPAELNQLYPPLQTKEWYRAEWPGSFALSPSRELDFGLFGGRPELKVVVEIRTEPDVPIKEVHGHLAFVKNNEVVYETQIEEKEDVSFTDSTLVFLRIPYDDSNPNHRTLRFAKESELTPVFRVRKVVFADGKEKTFD